jgi:pimeloyl-ACP methyl ester carboxylesterase
MTEDSMWLLLHGTPLTPKVWDGVRPHLEKERPVYAPLLPTPSTAEGAQREIAGVILASLSPPSGLLHVVGHSFGAQVAIEIALMAPTRIGSLTLLCSRATPFPTFASTATSLRDGISPDPEASLHRWFRPDEVAANGEVVRYARACIVGANRTIWADELDAIARYNQLTALTVIEAPTAVIAAAADHVGTPEEMSLIAGAIPDATYEVLADASHMSPFLSSASLLERLRSAASR